VLSQIADPHLVRKEEEEERRDDVTSQNVMCFSTQTIVPSKTVLTFLQPALS